MLPPTTPYAHPTLYPPAHSRCSFVCAPAKQIEAAAAGGSVHLLLGNHELMNLQGDNRYASKQEILQLGMQAEAASAGRNTSGGGDSNGGRGGGGSGAGKPAGKAAKADSRAAASKAGLRAWRHAFSPGGASHSLLQQHKLAALLGAGGCRTLFVHAAALDWMLEVPPAAANSTTLGDEDDPGLSLVGRWNDALRLGAFECRLLAARRGAAAAGRLPHRQLLAAQCAADSPLFPFMERLLGYGGPMWSRIFSNKPEPQLCPMVAKVLTALNASRVVVGHTIQANTRVNTRCGGRIVFLDVGLGLVDSALAAWSCSPSGDGGGGGGGSNASSNGGGSQQQRADAGRGAAPGDDAVQCLAHYRNSQQQLRITPA